jgi:hypothetical protein
MPDERAPDELDEYLRGSSAISRQYRAHNSPVPPHALDCAVLEASRPAAKQSAFRSKSTALAPLAFAASVFLSLAMVLAMVFGPQTKKIDDKPRVVQVRMFKSDPPRAPLVSPRERNPAAWLAYIESLRHANCETEADVEMRRFRSAYPDYVIPLNE